jgi:DNA-binding response OmpR family regulator
MGDEEPTVLFADDQPALADGHAAQLPDEYDVRTVYDGQRALEAIDDTVDVAVLDRRMPALTGDAVLEAVRDCDYDCRVIMLTGVEPEEDIVEMGFDEYLLKPVGGDELRETVARLLDAEPTENDVLDALGDPKTRHCLHVLSRGDYSARELADATGYSLTTVYRRLNALQQAELIDAKETLDPDGDHYNCYTAAVDSVQIAIDRGLHVETEPQGGGTA